MELRFSKEQEDMRQAVRQFAAEEVAPVVRVMEETDEFPAELVRMMAERGLFGIPVPKDKGGLGGDFISYIIAIHEIARVSAAVGVILSVHTSVGTLPILYYGSGEQVDQYVTRLASGAWLGAFALTEPHAGSDAGAIRTSATLEGDHYVLNGSKVFITNAGAADLYLLFAVTDRMRGSRGITAFLIGKGTPGFRVGRKEAKMGLHGSNTCELILEQVRIPISQRLGAEGEGFMIAKGTLDGGRIGIAAQALGIAEAALHIIEDHVMPHYDDAANRRSKLCADLHTFAEMTAKVEAARLLVYHAAWLRQSGAVCTKEASMAKMFASDTAVAVAGEAVRMLGITGCSKTSHAERLFRDAKVTQIYEGTNEIHRIVISSQLMK